MVKLLGIDYGDARTGLAYSDDLGLIAILSLYTSPSPRDHG